MDQVAEVREKIDIVSLIQEFVPLKKTGSNFKANCPFHNEKSPSFVVSPERQIWHCFGCQKGGDAFTFVMEYEHIEFPEALRMLAQRAGVQLAQYKFDTGVASKKEQIYKLNHLASEFYHFLLTQHPVGKHALIYLIEERKIKPQTINTYMLGFAPKIGNTLTQYLVDKKKYPKESLLEAGLATQYYGRIADFFRGRLMFPLYDHRGNTIGFSGRVLDPKVEPKYINTSETLAYHKGSVFFGLNSAKEAIKKENRAIIMEGEFDVISSFQEGITNCVAIKGTALTEEQVTLINRFAQKISLCFDEDSAGQEAVKRSLPILEKKGLSVTVIVPPDGKDADEAIKHNPIAFKLAVKHDMPIYDFLFEKTLARINPKTIDGKKKIAEHLLPVIADIQNEIVKEHYLQKLSRELSTSRESLVAEIEKLKKKEVIRREDIVEKKPQSREALLEEYLAALLVQHENPKVILSEVETMLSHYEFKTPAYQKIIEKLRIFSTNNPKFDPKQFFTSLPPELVPAFDVSFLYPIPKFKDEGHYKEEVKKKASDLYKMYLTHKIENLGKEIMEKEKDGMSDQENTLRLEQDRLIGLLPKI